MELKQIFQQFMTKACEQSKILNVISRRVTFCIFLYPVLILLYFLFYGGSYSIILMFLLSITRWLYLVSIILCIAQNKSRELFWSALITAVLLILLDFVDTIIFAVIAWKAYKSYKKTEEYHQLHTTVTNIAGQAATMVEAAHEKVSKQVSQQSDEKKFKTRRIIAISLLCLGFAFVLLVPFVHVRASISGLFGFGSSITKGINGLNSLLGGSENRSVNAFSAYAGFLSAENYSFFHLLVFGIALNEMDVWGYSSVSQEIIGICVVVLILIICLTFLAIVNVLMKKKITLPSSLLIVCYVFLLFYENFCAVNYFDSAIKVWTILAPVFPLAAIFVWNSVLHNNMGQNVVPNIDTGRNTVPDIDTGRNAVPDIDAGQNAVPDVTSDISGIQMPQMDNTFQSTSDANVEPLPADNEVSFVQDLPKFCGNCGAKLLPNAVFCQECGTKVPVNHG